MILKLRLTIVVFVLLINMGCHNRPQLDTKKGVDIDTFPNYLAYFPKITLPLRLKGCDIDVSNLHRLTTGSYAVGKFPAGNGVAAVTIEAADCLLPVITTYTTDGKKISSETIAIGYCDDGPCQDCSEYMEINKQLQLYTSDTTYIYPCDDEHNKIDGKATIRIIYKNGFIREDGSIKLSDEKQKGS